MFVSSKPDLAEFTLKTKTQQTHAELMNLWLFFFWQNVFLLKELTDLFLRRSFSKDWLRRAEKPFPFAESSFDFPVRCFPEHECGASHLFPVDLRDAALKFSSGKVLRKVTWMSSSPEMRGANTSTSISCICWAEMHLFT